MVTQRNVVSLVKGVDYVSITPNDILLSTGSSSFDATSFEYWSMLLNGGQLILCPETSLLDIVLLKEEIAKRNVNKMWFTAGWFNQLVDTEITLFSPLQTILVGGEKLSEQHIEKLRKTYPLIEILNGYGPTENTTFSLVYRVTESTINQPIPIGRPLNNRTALILDANNQLVPVGVSGEICLGGAGLSKGYLNQPELTAEKFVVNPFSGDKEEIIYKTGDQGRWLPDGNIEYLGRIDQQVKIRGYRIELGEIENVLLKSGLVKQGVVIAREDIPGIKRLVGYIVADGEVDKEAISKYLLEKLPEYMVPAIWVTLDSLPLTANGKINKKALPAPELGSLSKAEFIAPRNEPEAQLEKIWKELLHLERIGIHDNFFELGGDSILTIQVVSRARRLGFNLAPKDLFIHQTIARLSTAISERSTTLITGEQGVLNGPCGLLPIQQWYFETEQPQIDYYTQAILLGLDKSITSTELDTAFDWLIEHHDALRFKYYKQDNQWQQEYGNGRCKVQTDDLTNVRKDLLASTITEKSLAWQQSLDISNGDLVRVVLMQTPGWETRNRLLIIVHHLAVDGVSWRILLEDLERAVNEIKERGSVKPAPKTSSYRQWYQALEKWGQRQRIISQSVFWQTCHKKLSSIARRS
jgi:aryl carrier-like protein